MEEAERRIAAGLRALQYAREEGLVVDVTPVPQPALPPAPAKDSNPPQDENVRGVA